LKLHSRKHKHLETYGIRVDTIRRSTNFILRGIQGDKNTVTDNRIKFGYVYEILFLKRASFLEKNYAEDGRVIAVAG